MGFARIQTTPFVGSAGPSVSQSFTSNNQAGNLLLAIVNPLIGGTTITGISDTQGNTWLPITDGTNVAIIFFYCVSCKAGSNTVTVTLTGDVTLLSLAEYSGQITGLIPVLDAATVGANNSTGNPSTSLVLGQAGDLMIGVVWGSESSTFSTFTGGFSQQQGVAFSNFASSWCDNLSGSSGVNTFACTSSPQGAWFATMIAFVPAGRVIPSDLSFVRAVGGLTKQQAGSPAPVIFSGGCNIGDTILLVTETFIGTGSDGVTSITDTAGTAYTRLATQLMNSGLTGWASIWAGVTSVSVQGPNTVVVNFDNAIVNDAMEVFAAEFAGGYTFDTSTGVSVSTSGNSITNPITAAQANELLFSVFESNSVSTNMTFSSPQVALSSYNECGVAYMISVKGANSPSATNTLGGYNGGVTALSIVLKPASASGGGSTVTGFALGQLLQLSRLNQL